MMATLGRPAQKTETIDGATYGVSNTYDGSGRVATTAYPTGLTIQSVYTAFGHLSELRNAFSGVSYWRATSADARGNVTGATLGNGVSEVRSYDGTTGHLSTIQSSSAAAGKSRTSRTASTPWATSRPAPMRSRPSPRPSSTTP